MFENDFSGALKITVPIGKLKQFKSLVFEMEFHASTLNFKAVRILRGDDSEFVENAQFEEIALPNA